MNKQESQVDVCYVISHGFAARMLLQTGLIRKLTEAGKTVAIITPDQEDQNLARLIDNPLITIYNPGIAQTIWDDDYGVKRMYYLEDIKNNPVFWEKHLYSIFYTKSKHPWKRIRPFIYYPIHRLIPFFSGIRRRFKATEKKYLVSQKASELLHRINPRLVVSTYPVNFLEAKFLFAAQQQNRKTLIHLLSWDNITSKGIFPVIPDYFMAWGPIMAEELKEYYGTTNEQVAICGVPHFDHHHKILQSPNYQPLLEQLKLQPAHPYLFVAMSSPRFAPHEIDIVEWLAEAINRDVFGMNLQLVVRPHPQNVQGSLADKRWIGRLKRLNSGRVAVDFPQLNDSKVRWSMRPSDMDHLSNLLAGCAVCINSGSTVSIDALVMEKPVILTSFDADKRLYYWKSARRLVDYPHQKKFVALGGAKVVSDFDELKKTILAYLKNPSLEATERQNALARECYKNDGQSTERAVSAVLAFLNQSHG